MHPRDLVDADQRAAAGDGPAGAARGPGGRGRAPLPGLHHRRTRHAGGAGFPDNWIYINDASVEVGRIQNFGVWSPYLVKDGRTCLGLEYFVNEGDDMWTKADQDLVEQGKALT